MKLRMPAERRDSMVQKVMKEMIAYAEVNIFEMIIVVCLCFVNFSSAVMTANRRKMEVFYVVQHKFCVS